MKLYQYSALMSLTIAATAQAVPAQTVPENLMPLPVALVYQGAGSCEVGEPDGCSESVARVARSAGYEVVFVDPAGAALGAATEDSWHRAKVWLQPGGRAKIQVQTMTTELKVRIRDFVADGGGYVGFCAGGFLATEKFGWEDTETPANSFESPGLGLLPGNSRYYDKYDAELSADHTAKLVATTWSGSTRTVYWELGPYFDSSTTGSASRSSAIETLSSYPTGEAMTVRAKFGKGRVFVTAVHPEAPLSWYEYYGLQDPDGLDAELAKSMIGWAAHP